MLTDKIVQRPASPWETFFGGKENFEKLARRYGYPGTYTGNSFGIERCFTHPITKSFTSTTLQLVSGLLSQQPNCAMTFIIICQSCHKLR
jgi:hypothetical protein